MSLTWLMFRPSRSDLSTGCGPDMADACPVILVPTDSPANDAPVPNKTLLLVVSFQLEHLTSRCGYILQDHGFDPHEQAEVREFTVCALACHPLIVIDGNLSWVLLALLYSISGCAHFRSLLPRQPCGPNPGQSCELLFWYCRPSVRALLFPQCI